MRCKVKSINERNPCFLLLTGKAEDSKKTACDKQEEGEDDVKYHGPYGLGYTCATMVTTK